MQIDWAIVARAIHVLAVVWWIGGVTMVTTVLLPAIRKDRPDRALEAFDAIERRFAPQARVAVLLVLLSGLYMLDAYDMWDRFAEAAFWWMDVMVGVWVVFAALLFVIEPLAGPRIRRRQEEMPPRKRLAGMMWMHGVLLTLSLAAIFAAVGGAHGLFG